MSSPELTLCIIWLDVLVWLPIAALLWKKKFKFTAVLTFLYWMSSTFWVICRWHGACALSQDNIYSINDGIESSWISAAIQLLTFELEISLALMQFGVLTILNNITRVVLSQTMIVVSDVTVTFVVIALNWKLGGHKIPIREPSFWIVPVLIFVGLLTFLVQPTEVAELMFRRLFSLGVVFAILEKSAWKRYGWVISPTPTAPTSPNSTVDVDKVQYSKQAM